MQRRRLVLSVVHTFSCTWGSGDAPAVEYDDGGIIRFFRLVGWVGACFFDVYRLLAVAITGWSAGLAAVIFIYWGFV